VQNNFQEPQFQMNQQQESIAPMFNMLLTDVEQILPNVQSQETIR